MSGATISSRQAASAAAEMCDVCERVTCLKSLGIYRHYRHQATFFDGTLYGVVAMLLLDPLLEGG